VRRQGLYGAELRRDPVRSVMDTLGIGINVLEAAAQARLEKFILLSSCTGYPEGPSPKEEESFLPANLRPIGSAWVGSIAFSKSSSNGIRFSLAKSVRRSRSGPRSFMAHTTILAAS
jgi:hypothetical protein